MAEKKKSTIESAAPASDKKKALETAMAQIERTYGKGSIMRLGENQSVVVDAIPTGSLSLDIALGIGHHQQRAQRAAAFELQGDTCPLPLQGIAHQGGRRQSAAQSGGSHRGGIVDLTGTLRQIAAANGGSLHEAVAGNGSYNLIHG